jgi:hypothetical protein
LRLTLASRKPIAMKLIMLKGNAAMIGTIDSGNAAL